MSVPSKQCISIALQAIFVMLFLAVAQSPARKYIRYSANVLSTSALAYPGSAPTSLAISELGLTPIPRTMKSLSISVVLVLVYALNLSVSVKDFYTFA